MQRMRTLSFPLAKKYEWMKYTLSNDDEKPIDEEALQKLDEEDIKSTGPLLPFQLGDVHPRVSLYGNT